MLIVFKCSIYKKMARINWSFFIGSAAFLFFVYVECKEKSTFPKTLKDIEKLVELEKIKNKIRGNIQQIKENKSIVEPVPTTVLPSPRPVLIISERADRNDCMIFHLKNGNVVVEEAPSQVDLWVYIKESKKKKKKESKRNTTEKNKGRRLKLIVTYEEQKLSTLIVRVQKSMWHKIEMPISVIQNVFQTPNKTLNLCITCKGCNKRYKALLLHNDNSNNTKRKNRAKPKISDTNRLWPFLVLHIKSQ
ncbi:hypothetical protein ACJMK2_023263 [Sinanodonta woodiana]|uniref:Uncharacterized protein n=1 Tax=Sinanodonta woodiana TaxID=1069815 RepID=A0ABD3T3T6_SINWO